MRRGYDNDNKHQDAQGHNDGDMGTDDNKGKYRNENRGEHKNMDVHEDGGLVVAKNMDDYRNKNGDTAAHGDENKDSPCWRERTMTPTKPEYTYA